MSDFVFAPPPQPYAPVRGGGRFAVRRIYCVGRNYAEHAREMGHEPGREPPFFFDKPADALVISGAGVPYPPETADLHHEIELVVAIGGEARDLAPEAVPAVIYGYAVGVMVLGIALGETLVIGLKGSETSVALFALVLLNLATVALFLQRNAPQRRSVGPTAPLPPGPLAEPPTSEEQTPASVLPPQPAYVRAPLPTHITDRLSEQEQRVLEAAMENRPYREIAQAFGISESSVKTYMQRIYRKLGIYRRGQLEGLLTDDRDRAAPARNP